jgi:uncharacterized protein (TIRG00374 family)
MIVQGILFTVSLVLVVPGGGGSVELLALLILPHFIPKSLIGVVLLMWRFLTYHLNILVGGAAFFRSVHDLAADEGLEAG